MCAHMYMLLTDLYKPYAVRNRWDCAWLNSAVGRASLNRSRWCQKVSRADGSYRLKSQAPLVVIRSSRNISCP